MYYVLYIMFYVLCFMFYVLCFMFYVYFIFTLICGDFNNASSIGFNI